MLAIGLGLHALMHYNGRAGHAGVTPLAWPSNDTVTLAASNPTLIMFAHPQCPCTKASLGELESLVAKAPGRFEGIILFNQPGRNFQSWTNSALVKSARTIPSVHIFFDYDGTVAKKFGAETSGYTVVYSRDGQLLFSGGITGSRGHLGDNTGFQAVLNIVNVTPTYVSASHVTMPSSRSTAPVFGCELFDQCPTSQTARRN